MPSIINTNVASLNAQRNLTSSQASLTTALQRLSSGLRINSAKDDAAGLAISDRMTTQINGLNQAVRNANDGISLAQTAEGAMGAAGSMLQRIRELAVQSANASNVSTDRASLNSEAQQLLQEIQRISTTTQFNGQNILDGTFSTAQFQVGANANQTILASIANSQTSALGSYQATSGATAVTGTALAGGDLTINGVNTGASNSGSAEDIATAINSVTSQTGVTANASTSVSSATVNPLLRNQSLTSGDLVINTVNVGAVAGSSNIATQGKNIATAINAVTAQTGVSAVADSSTGALTLTSTTGKTIAITSNNGNAGATRVENASGLELASATKTFGTSTITFTNGVAQVATLVATSLASATDTITVAGKTLTFGTGANSATNIQISTTSATQATNIQNALSLAFAGTNLVSATVAADTVTLTSLVNVKSTAATDGLLAISETTTNVGTVAQTTAGSGVAVGDTLQVGGLTYEFTLPTASAAGTTGNIQVKLGATDTATATNFANALLTQANAKAGTVGLTSNAGGVVVVTNTLYGDTNVVAAPTEPVTTGSANNVSATNTAGANGVYGANTTYGTLALNSASSFSIAGNNPSKAGLGNAQVTLSAISGVNISSVAGANNAIALIDGALTQLDSGRGDLGALQNRFQSTVSNLGSTVENLTAARSRIQDTDFASETAALTRGQILQQAGTAMLAQANALPNGVLALLR